MENYHQWITKSSLITTDVIKKLNNVQSVEIIFSILLFTIPTFIPDGENENIEIFHLKSSAHPL